MRPPGDAVETTVKAGPAAAPNAPPLQLLVLSREQLAVPATLMLPPTGEGIVGRAPDALVRIDDPMASRHHARIVIAPGGVTVCDLGSSNGTLLGGQKLGGEPTAFLPGDVLTIGSTVILLQALPRLQRTRHPLMSHSYFVARLEEECVRAEELKTAFTVVRCRLAAPFDRTAVPRALSALLRPLDVLAAFGDLDLEVLLPGVSLREAPSWTEKLAGALASTEVGAASWPENGKTADVLLAATSAALLAAPETAGTQTPDVLVVDDHMREVFEVAGLAAASDASVLIVGETGVGKDVLARWIHERSSRAPAPFVHIDVGALPGTLLESELFGYARGAFTGAARMKPGLLEGAQGGTVFLNELGELPLALQPKLLRAIQEKVFRRLGDPLDRSLDVRWIAATNQDLQRSVAEKTFRSDLYYRLAVVTLALPPLRERLAEIEPLARLFLRRFCERYRRSPAPDLSPEAVSLLEGHAWPGNVRELANVIERAVVICRSGRIGPEHLPEHLRQTPELFEQDPEKPEDSSPDAHNELLRALQAHRWRIAVTARALGISRTTLWKRMRALGLPSMRGPAPGD